MPRQSSRMSSSATSTSFPRPGAIPASAEAAQEILERFMDSAVNLPSEIRHLYTELTHTSRLLASAHAAWNSETHAHLSTLLYSTPRSTAEATALESRLRKLRRSIDSHNQTILQLSDTKIVLAQRAVTLLDRHIGALDAEIAGLDNNDVKEEEDEDVEEEEEEEEGEGGREEEGRGVGLRGSAGRFRDTVGGGSRVRSSLLRPKGPEEERLVRWALKQGAGPVREPGFLSTPLAGEGSPSPSPSATPTPTPSSSSTVRVRPPFPPPENSVAHSYAFGLDGADDENVSAKNNHNNNNKEEDHGDHRAAGGYRDDAANSDWYEIANKIEFQNAEDAEVNGDDDDNDNGDEEDDEEEEEEIGADEDRDGDGGAAFCYCRKNRDGAMLACDMPGCRYEWYHHKCVGVVHAPAGRWYCPLCLWKRGMEEEAVEKMK